MPSADPRPVAVTVLYDRTRDLVRVPLMRVEAIPAFRQTVVLDGEAVGELRFDEKWHIIVIDIPRATHRLPSVVAGIPKQVVCLAGATGDTVVIEFVPGSAGNPAGLRQDTLSIAGNSDTETTRETVSALTLYSGNDGALHAIAVHEASHFIHESLFVA